METMKPTDVLLQYRNKKRLQIVTQSCLKNMEKQKFQKDRISKIVAVWRLARTKYRGRPLLNQGQ